MTTIFDIGIGRPAVAFTAQQATEAALQSLSGAEMRRIRRQLDTGRPSPNAPAARREVRMPDGHVLTVMWPLSLFPDHAIAEMHRRMVADCPICRAEADARRRGG